MMMTSFFFHYPNKHLLIHNQAGENIKERKLNINCESSHSMQKKQYKQKVMYKFKRRLGGKCHMLGC